MSKDEHWRFARHARDLSDDKLIRNHVAENGYREPGEGLDDLAEMVDGLGRAGHEVTSCQLSVASYED